MRGFYQGVLVVGVGIVAQSVAMGAASVTYVGAQLNLGDGWRTPSVSKTYDIDSNNVYGSLGWKMVHVHGGNYSNTTGQWAGQIIESLPSYITILPHNPGGVLPSPETGANIAYSANYTLIDDPNGGPDIWSGISYKNFAQPNELTHLYNVTFSAGTSPTATYRVGVLVDNIAPISGSPVALQVKGYGGAQGDSGLIAKSQYTQKNDYHFFDVTGAVAGDVFGIYTKRTGSEFDPGPVAIGGFTVDAVPEPGSLGVLLLSSMYFVRRRQHRR